jgi:hypothetical protein
MFDNILIKSTIFKLEPLGVFGGHEGTMDHTELKSKLNNK